MGNGIDTSTFYCPYIPENKLVLNEGRIHGAKYYTVFPVFHDWRELEAWANIAYGEPATIWNNECGRWYMNNSKFWFRDPADRTMFVLRWV
jgi:hypothetical protein